MKFDTTQPREVNEKVTLSLGMVVKTGLMKKLRAQSQISAEIKNNTENEYLRHTHTHTYADWQKMNGVRISPILPQKYEWKCLRSDTDEGRDEDFGGTAAGRLIDNVDRGTTNLLRWVSGLGQRLTGDRCGRHPM